MIVELQAKRTGMVLGRKCTTLAEVDTIKQAFDYLDKHAPNCVLVYERTPDSVFVDMYNDDIYIIRRVSS